MGVQLRVARPATCDAANAAATTPSVSTWVGRRDPGGPAAPRTRTPTRSRPPPGHGPPPIAVGHRPGRPAPRPPTPTWGPRTSNRTRSPDPARRARAPRRRRCGDRRPASTARNASASTVALQTQARRRPSPASSPGPPPGQVVLVRPGRQARQVVVLPARRSTSPSTTPPTPGSGGQAPLGPGPQHPHHPRPAPQQPARLGRRQARHPGQVHRPGLPQRQPTARPPRRPPPPANTSNVGRPSSGDGREVGRQGAGAGCRGGVDGAGRRAPAPTAASTNTTPGEPGRGPAPSRRSPPNTHATNSASASATSPAGIPARAQPDDHPAEPAGQARQDRQLRPLVARAPPPTPPPPTRSWSLPPGRPARRRHLRRAAETGQRRLARRPPAGGPAGPAARPHRGHMIDNQHQAHHAEQRSWRPRSTPGSNRSIDSKLQSLFQSQKNLRLEQHRETPGQRHYWNNDWNNDWNNNHLDLPTTARRQGPTTRQGAGTREGCQGDRHEGWRRPPRPAPRPDQTADRSREVAGPHGAAP